MCDTLYIEWLPYLTEGASMQSRSCSKEDADYWEGWMIHMERDYFIRCLSWDREKVTSRELSGDREYSTKRDRKYKGPEAEACLEL